MERVFEFVVDHQHPAFAGHFPGMPIVPGVLLLDWIICAIAEREHWPAISSELNVAKFLTPVQPGETLSVRYEFTAGEISCRVECKQRLVATAALILHAQGKSAS